jgi:hypothetical protein
MRQEAPDPKPLRDLVKRHRGKPGERVYLTGDDYDRGQGSHGLTLIVNITGPDSYDPERHISVNHLFPVPPAAYDVRSWRRWLFDRLSDVDRHERCEWFQEVRTSPRGFIRSDGSHVDEVVERPYAPSHGPGNDPYLVREIGTDEDRRTSFRGELQED